ncbi:NUDIX domain-containing protein [Jidongwangia harbinensis]|uniref:NUDIX domain-containing protein n=1 Tax=Jidongwangia harbinensis TaxID=2878561 RepID=UPI001CD961FB|nr:NUDIX hydrolase [Jidongwangia harbinensis]MCA2218153.1 NUDIX hydrolase [Jidongwangia harbinensis]
MRSSVTAVHDAVSQLQPVDAVEDTHRDQVLRWLSHTDDVFRRVKPAVPPQHLVSYVVPVDPSDGSILLVDHINAGLWLPPGGHVEVDEHPARTARREVREELGLVAGNQALDEQPIFLTVTRTVGLDAGHTDVSLWYVLHCRRDQPLKHDQSEFRRVRWWTAAELRDADRSRFDPHFFRFLAKLAPR